MLKGALDMHVSPKLPANPKGRGCNLRPRNVMQPYLSRDFIDPCKCMLTFRLARFSGVPTGINDV